MKFIPAKESPFYIWFFTLVTRYLMFSRFQRVWLKQSYTPAKNAKTVYFMNHNLWWDGLLPLYLSRQLFNQKARAIMEDKQMIKHPFFAKIGAFSINLEDPKSTIRTLRFAIESMDRDHASLFLYPEGEITHASNEVPSFKNGISWLYQHMTDVDFVPISFFSHNLRQSKPELYINIGEKIELPSGMDRSEISDEFARVVHSLLIETKQSAGYSDTGFERVKV